MGTKSFASVPLRMSALSSSSDGSSPSKYFSIAASSCSTTISMSFSRHSCACSCRSSRISTTSKAAPSSSPWFQTISFICTRSMTPSNSSSAPMGSVKGRGTHPSMSSTMSRHRKKLAPMRSILLTKSMRGTPYLSAWRHTVSDCGSTPATLSRQHTAPSSTRRARSTSSVKSTCPGVSMMLMRWSFHAHVVAADVIVIPRSCSCSIQSMVAPPSCTSPILYDFPV
mmetsp:Transcript_7219/g.16485  ORF Transcript_7219/g.16485 Transcript_7219/m.16485 type:complete len:226 (-) Transcript_7219:220-897(-)